MRSYPMISARHIFFFACFLFAALGVASEVYAAAGKATLGRFCPTDGNAGIVELMVTCIRDIILEAAYRFIAAIYPVLQQAIYAFLTLSVIFLGAMMLMGALEKPGRDASIFLLKFAAVVYFTANMDVILDWMVGALDDLVGAVTEFTIFDFPLKCPNESADWRDVWGRIDCLLDVILGVNTAGSLSNGMLAFFFHNFFVGSVGVIIALIGIWMLFAFVMGMLTAIQTYLLALITISLLVIIGIIFLPLVMLKNTYENFQRWWRMLVGSVLIPVVLFAYLNVMLSAFDIVLYSGEHSVFRVFAGAQVDNENFSIHEYLYNNGLVEEFEDKGPIHDQRQTQFATPQGTVLKGLLYQFGQYPDTASRANPANIAEIPIAIPMQKINYDAAAGMVGGGSGADLMGEVLAAMIMTGLIAYILVTMLQYVPMLAQDLAGGQREAPGIAQVSAQDMPMVGHGGSSVTEGFRQRMSGMIGARK